MGRPLWPFLPDINAYEVDILFSLCLGETHQQVAAMATVLAIIENRTHIVSAKLLKEQI